MLFRMFFFMTDATHIRSAPTPFLHFPKWIFNESTMISPTAQSSSHLPAKPSLQVLLSWMENSEFAVYKELMQSASEKHAIVPEEIRSVTAKCLWEELGLPSFGVALQFVWAVFMSDASEDGKKCFNCKVG